MNESHKITIILLIYAILYTIDINTNKCLKRLSKKEKVKAFRILMIHHLYSSFANFGWILNNKFLLIIYILFPLSAILHWNTNENECVWTQDFNKLCGYKHYEYFHDLFYWLKIKELHPAYYVLTILIALYKLIFS
jgi:hypothetical protein